MKKTISLVMVLAIMVGLSLNTVCVAAAPKAFTDVKAGSWYKSYVDDISSKGIITGYGNGKFGPNDKLQVDQLLTMMVKANNEQTTKLTSDKYWADQYIRKATELGWVKSGEFTTYKKNITRGEIARIIARAMTDYPDNLHDYKSLIKDYESIDTTLRDYILKVYAKGIVGGNPDGTFKANNNATRAEAATMIVKYLEPTKRSEPAIVIGDTQQVINGFKAGIVGKTSTLATIEGCDLKQLGDQYPYIQLSVSMYNLDDRSKDLEDREKQFVEAREILTQKIDAKVVDEAIAYAKTKKDYDFSVDKDFVCSGYCLNVYSAYLDDKISFFVHNEKYAR